MSLRDFHFSFHSVYIILHSLGPYSIVSCTAAYPAVTINRSIREMLLKPNQ
jgi:hypothetical protein